VTQPSGSAVDPAWLSLRAAADLRARTTFASGLAAELARHLGLRLSEPAGTVRLVDVGAGTGSGARWLRARLPFTQDWRLVDHDGRILAATPRDEAWGRSVVAGVEDLPRLLADEPAHVVTCQALLDVLTEDQVDAMLTAALSCRAALLLGLSVTGDVDLAPEHPDDDVVDRAFNAHQRRAGRLGPDGGAYAADALRRHGYAVKVAATPWRLGAADSALFRAWVQGRAAAALEQEPAQADRITRWRQHREEAAGRGDLDAVVGHIDVLGLPHRRPGAA
jgi:hypothetical protein